MLCDLRGLQATDIITCREDVIPARRAPPAKPDAFYGVVDLKTQDQPGLLVSMRHDMIADRIANAFTTRDR